MSFYDKQKTSEQKLGQKIYQKALSDRRGFRPDQIGIDVSDDVWTEIFQHIGEVALNASRT